METFKKIRNVIIGIAWTFLVIAVFLSVFITRIDGKNKVLYDGLGRKLTEAPTLVKYFWVTDTWPGLKWTIIDLVIFWGLVAITAISFSTDKN